MDNRLLNQGRSEGLFLQLDRLPEMNIRCPRLDRWPEAGRQPSGRYQVPELFACKRDIVGKLEGGRYLEQDQLEPMPWIMASHSTILAGAQVNTQAGFDRACRTIVKEPGYHGWRRVLILCLNTGSLPCKGQILPLTRCSAVCLHPERSREPSDSGTVRNFCAT